MDYLSFYSQHVKDLKKEGKEFKGWCPFHPDEGGKTKGFAVNIDNGVWYCHSCGTGGNATTFCQKKGIPLSKAPDHEDGWNRYSYGRGIVKRKPGKKMKKQGRTELWEGTGGEGLDGEVKPYSHQAIDWAREQKRPLWICEGEKDTLTMLEAGELAIGIPSATTDKVLDAIRFDSIKGVELIVACDNDEAGEKVTEKILARFPWALKIEWPSNKQEHFDVTDLKEEEGEGFTDTLRGWTVEAKDPFESTEKVLHDKYLRDGTRQPGELLGYKLTKFDKLGRNIDGVQPGFYIVAADTNAGKTAFLCNITLDLLDSNPHLAGIYFSLDDSRDVILNRFLSIESDIPLNQVQKKQRNEKHEKMLDKAYTKLMDLSRDKRLFVRDGSEIADVFALEGEIKRRMRRGLFVVIDALYNLDIGEDTGDSRRENIIRANRLKALATEYQLPVICTGELVKNRDRIEKDRPPSVHDLMETGKFAYNANLVLMLYPQKWEDYNQEDEPTLRMKYEKNKLSHVRGTASLTFKRKTSVIEEEVEPIVRV